MAHWIAVVNRAQARIFKDGSEFLLVDQLDYELGREKNRAMTTDKPGLSRAKQAGRSGTHALDGEKNPHEGAAIQFAKIVAGYLEKKFASALSQTRLTIASEPRMTGYLRDAMSESSRKKARWLCKDLAYFSDNEIKRYLQERRNLTSFINFDETR